VEQAVKERTTERKGQGGLRLTRGSMRSPTQQHPHPLPLGYSRRPFSSAILPGPIGHLAQPDLVLYGIAVNGHGEFRHRIRILRGHLIVAKLDYGDGDRLIEVTLVVTVEVDD
jgi:hypothetical protein